MEIQRKPIVISVDFDGTCVTHAFPNVGIDIGAENVLRKLVDKGHQLILWTMRSDDFLGDKTEHNFTSGLTDAINWFKDRDIPLYGIQRNPTQDNWTTSPKCYAQLYIDDAALGCPLTFNPKLSDRPFVDWYEVEQLLILSEIL